MRILKHCSDKLSQKFQQTLQRPFSAWQCSFLIQSGRGCVAVRPRPTSHVPRLGLSHYSLGPATAHARTPPWQVRQLTSSMVAAFILVKNMYSVCSAMYSCQPRLHHKRCQRWRALTSLPGPLWTHGRSECGQRLWPCPGHSSAGKYCSCFSHVCPCQQCEQGHWSRCPSGSDIMLDLFPPLTISEPCNFWSRCNVGGTTTRYLVARFWLIVVTKYFGW